MKITKNNGSIEFGEQKNDYIKQKKNNVLASASVESGEYPFFTSSYTVKSIDSYQFDGDFLIFGTGGIPNCNYFNGKFNSSGDTIVINYEGYNNKYIYYYLNNNMHLLNSCFFGMVLRHLNENLFKKSNLRLPKVSYQNKVVDLLDKKKSHIDNIKALITNLGKRNQYYFNLLINNNILNKEVINVKIKDIIIEKEKSTLNVCDATNTSEYPFYNCSKNTKYSHNTYNHEGESIILSAGCEANIHYSDTKFSNSNNTYVIYSNIYSTKYIYYYLKQNIVMINRFFHGVAIKLLNKKVFKNQKISILKNIDDQKYLVNILDKLILDINNLKEILKNEEAKFKWISNALLLGEYIIED